METKLGPVGVIERNDRVHHIKTQPARRVRHHLRAPPARQNTAMISSPMNLSMVPSYFCTTGTSQSKQALINSRTFRDPILPESAVNPETSANTIVTSLRSSVSWPLRAVSSCVQLFPQRRDRWIDHSVTQTFSLRFQTCDRR